MKIEFKKILKVLILFILYFICYDIFSAIFSLFNITNEAVIGAVSDLIFLVFIILVYKNRIKESLKKFNQKYDKLSKKVLFVIKWVLILYGVSVLLGIIADILVPNLGLDENTNTVYENFTTQKFYMIIKLMLIGVVVDTIMFIEPIREVVKNKIIFVLISATFYAIINVTATYDSFSLTAIADFFQMFLLQALLLQPYLKCDDNIFAAMLIKFCYNLIPFTIMILGI